ncbi:MAG TPA: HD domain-containing phosphohydrolase [Gemmatimonadaceae bacterium]|nr:HD domain-containing phosphohydrolase [Gemmatimonadaceae bacterium]
MKRPSNTTQRVAALLGVAVPATAIALRRRHRALAKFERLGAAALETLLNAIDANDPITGAHVRRVARYSLVLVDAMGCDAHEAHVIERVALFHDIGKIHEALFDVIHDHSKLDPAERREIRTHPVRGAKVLEPLAAFYPDLPKGVVAHHERWDGSGYPRGLKRNAIPLSSRVVAIADTFDAITHSRRYRAGRSVSVALDVIRDGRATQFDPDLVDLFLAPPVIAGVRAEMHAASAMERAPERHKRAQGGERVDAPDVSFRWRDTAPRQPRAKASP